MHEKSGESGNAVAFDGDEADDFSDCVGKLDVDECDAGALWNISSRSIIDDCMEFLRLAVPALLVEVLPEVEVSSLRS